MKNWQRLYLKENLFFIYEINNHNGYISDSIQLMTLKTKSYLDKKKLKKNIITKTEVGFMWLKSDMEDKK